MATQDTQDTATSEIDPQAAWEEALEICNAEGMACDAETYTAYVLLMEDHRILAASRLFLEAAARS